MCTEGKIISTLPTIVNYNSEVELTKNSLYYVSRVVNYDIKPFKINPFLCWPYPAPFCLFLIFSNINTSFRQIIVKSNLSGIQHGDSNS